MAGVAIYGQLGIFYLTARWRSNKTISYSPLGALFSASICVLFARQVLILWLLALVLSKSLHFLVFCILRGYGVWNQWNSVFLVDINFLTKWRKERSFWVLQKCVVFVLQLKNLSFRCTTTRSESQKIHYHFHWKS